MVFIGIFLFLLLSVEGMENFYKMPNVQSVETEEKYQEYFPTVMCIFKKKKNYTFLLNNNLCLIAQSRKFLKKQKNSEK